MPPSMSGMPNGNLPRSEGKPTKYISISCQSLNGTQIADAGLIYEHIYRKDLILHQGHSFTLGTSKEGTFSRQGAYFFFEIQLNTQNKTLRIILLKKGTMTETETETNIR